MTGLNRRGWGVGVVLGAAALGTGAWLHRRQAAVDADELAATPPGASSPGAGPNAGASALAAPMASGATTQAAGLSPIPSPLTTMDGRTLTSADVAGRAVVLNFWAPWCPPCVREMPELDRFSRSTAGRNVLVIGLAIDERVNVDRFLTAHPVGFRVAVLGYAGMGWVRQLSGNGNPALPFSAVFDRSQRLTQRKFGPTNAAELTQWLKI